jgi:hypothetical protein
MSEVRGVRLCADWLAAEQIPASTPRYQFSVRTPAEYRREAEEYVRRAEDLGADPLRCERLLHMAQSCLRLAQQAEWLSREACEEQSPERIFSGL